MRKTLILFLSALVCSGVDAQDQSVQQYIETYKDMAVREMKRSGIPASITLAQGILESESGKSDLVLRSNNHFGIKCKTSWTGGSVYHDDDERGECFRKYNSAEESFRDHSDFLKNSQRYAALFSLDIKDYKGWAFGLKKAGYATNPRYPYILINSIERYNLQQYTLAGLSVDLFDEGKYKDENNAEQTIAVAASADNNESHSIDVGKKQDYNGLKAIYASKETSLLAIATENDIPLSKLLEYNDRKKDGLLEETQWIYLERKNKEGNEEYYVAKGGETLYSVSQKKAVQLEYLKHFNKLDDEIVLQPGMKIALKDGIAINKVEVKTDNARKVHEVAKGEGLFAISRKYNVSVEELKQWNKLSSDNLSVGQQLLILK